jgi:hypothetical protein
VYYVQMRRTAGSLAVLAAAALAAALATGASPPGDTHAQVPLGRCSDGAAPAVAFSVPLPGPPGQMLLSKGTLWVAIEPARWGRPGRLLAFEASSGRLRRTIPVPVSPMRFVAAFGSLWLTGAGGGGRYSGVLRLDPRSGRVLRVIRGAQPLGSALAATTRGVWVGGADTFPQGHEERSGVYFVYEIDPRRGTVVRRVRLRSTVIDLVGDGPALWVTGWLAVPKLSEAGRVLFRQAIIGSGWSIARAGEGVWVTHTFNGSRRDRNPPPARELYRIRESSKPHLTRIPLEESPWAVSAAGGVAWVAAGRASHEVLWLDDTRTPSPTAVRVSGLVRGVQAAARGAWVAQLRPSQLSRIC